MPTNKELRTTETPIAEIHRRNCPLMSSEDWQSVDLNPDNSNQVPTSQSQRLLRLEQIVGKGGLLPVSKSIFYEWIKENRIPKPIKLGERISAWRERDILKFIEDCEEAYHE